ncbi:MAG: DNA methyltransferase [Pseudomonadota bacterium]
MKLELRFFCDKAPQLMEPLMASLTVVEKPIAELVPRARNPRRHSENQLQQLMRSIDHFGFTNPVLIDQNQTLIAGHGRVEAAKRLGMTQVPTICLSEMSEHDVCAYVIADNKLAENAGWDDQLLALEFEYLENLNIDIDLSLTGFELPEIDIAIQSLTLVDQPEKADPSDQVPEINQGPAVTQTGDVWYIGPHRLICGDSTNAETYQILLGDLRVQMVFSDPPYNVPIDGHVSGLGKTKHREFEMASGEMSEIQFTKFLTDVFEQLAHFSADGSIHFHCMDWRHIPEITSAGRAVYSELKNLCVWTKTNGGMGSLYRSQHELVFVFKSGAATHINNVELGKHGRNRTNVWAYAGANAFGAGQNDLNLHPTVKPVALVRDAIMDCSHRNDSILDPFCGSGSTLIAAHETGRLGYRIEIDPCYCDVIVKRFAETCGINATLGQDGPTFDDVASERAKQSTAETETMGAN